MKEILRNKIVSDFKDYSDLVTIIEEKKKGLEENKETIKKGSLANVEEKIEFYQNFYIDYTLFISDQRTVFNRLFFYIDLYRDLSYDGLPEEIVKFYNDNKTFAPKQIFVIKDGNLIEKEEGSLQKERDNFLKSDFLKNLIKGVE